MFKECCCPGNCHNQVDVSDFAPEDLPTAVVCCDDCADHDCDPFANTTECRAERMRFDAAEEDAAHGCPQCNGDGNVLGCLGNRVIFRCRQCGWEWGEVLP